MALLSDNPEQAGSQVAQATGVAYKDLATSEEQREPDVPSYDPTVAKEQIDQTVKVPSGMSYVDADKSTVSGQLTSLLSGDSAYIKEARRRGEESAQKRGLLSSSISAGASQREAIGAALPVAQQDAQTYAQAQARQQAADTQMQTIQGEAIVSGEMNKWKAQVDQNTARVQNAFTAKLEGASAESKVLLQDMQNQFTEGLQNLEFEQNKVIQTQQITAEKATSIRAQSSAIMQNYQISVENMLTDPDFLNLGKTAVNNAINQMQQLARNSINFLGSSSGVDMTPFVNAYLANITVL